MASVRILGSAKYVAPSSGTVHTLAGYAIHADVARKMLVKIAWATQDVTIVTAIYNGAGLSGVVGSLADAVSGPNHNKVQWAILDHANFPGSSGDLVVTFSGSVNECTIQLVELADAVQGAPEAVGVTVNGTTANSVSKSVTTIAADATLFSGCSFSTFATLSLGAGQTLIDKDETGPTVGLSYEVRASPGADTQSFSISSNASRQAISVISIAPAAVATPKISTLQTQFPGTVLQSPFVDSSGGGSATVASNRLALSSGDAATEQGSGETDPTVYDLDESAIYFSMTPSLLADFSVVILDANDNGYRIDVDAADNWVVYRSDADDPTNVFSVPYNATTMKWWRIREASGVIHFETAPASGNSPGSFTDQFSEATDTTAAFDHTAVPVALRNSYVATANSISYVEAINMDSVPVAGGNSVAVRDRVMPRGLMRGVYHV